MFAIYVAHHPEDPLQIYEAYSSRQAADDIRAELERQGNTVEVICIGDTDPEAVPFLTREIQP